MSECPTAAGFKARGQSLKPWLRRGHSLAHDPKVLELAPQEQRVVHGHEGREVLVQRGWLDAEAARHLGQAEGVDALFGHDRIREIDDLGHGLLVAPSPPVPQARIPFTGQCWSPRSRS